MNAEIKDKIESLSAFMSSALLEKMPYEPNPLISRESHRKKIQFEVEEDLGTFVARIASGLQEIDSIKERLAPFEPQIFTPEVLSAIARLCREDVELQQLALESLRNSKILIKEQMGINDEVLRAMYRASVEIYHERRYSEAAAAFSILTLMDLPQHDAWIGLGNAEFYSHRYQSALIAYAMAARANPGNPMSHFYSANCYEALKQYDYAINSLEIAQFVLKDNPRYSGWEQKANESKQRLQKLVQKS
jgi:type III secretion system low calcium response chaperone LcrH/SycD